METKYLLDTNVLISMFKNKGNYPYLESYGKIKALLEAQGQRIDDFDILIGVTALRNGYTMVTANVKHLSRIPNLNIVNWE